MFKNISTTFDHAICFSGALRHDDYFIDGGLSTKCKYNL